MLGFTLVTDCLFRCDTCGELVQSGISTISGHWVKCAGKESFDKVNKINKMSLKVDDKIDLIKHVFKKQL